MSLLNLTTDVKYTFDVSMRNIVQENIRYIVNTINYLAL